MYVSSWPALHLSLFRKPPGDQRVLPFPFHDPHARYFYRARNGIFHLFRALQFKDKDVVLVPSYHHGNEVRAIRAAGASVMFYPVTQDLEPDLNAVEQLCTSRTRALFVIHYLGWSQPLSWLVEFCRARGLLLIEDCALALLSQCGGRPLGSYGDYAIFCLYKTLPVPNGGLLVQNRHRLADLDNLDLVSCRLLSLTSRTSDLVIEALQSRWGMFGGALTRLKGGMGIVLNHTGVRREAVGDSGFNAAEADLAMSGFCHYLLRYFDFDTIRQKRRENFLRLLRLLPEKAPCLRRDLPNGVCPLFFPLLIKDKLGVSTALRRRGIGAIEFWNEGDPAADRATFPDAWFLRDHVLGLPIHQDLSEDQLWYMAEQVSELQPSRC